MSDQTHGAPSWLFSFVDLAFLLLIAMTQLGESAPIDLGELVVPKIHAESTNDLPADSKARWQLRVHPPEAETTSPFELVIETDGKLEGDYFGPLELRDRLAELVETGENKPVLAPHEDSRSGDMLDAVAILEDFWPTRRRVTVEPILAQQ